MRTPDPDWGLIIKKGAWAYLAYRRETRGGFLLNLVSQTRMMNKAEIKEGKGGGEQSRLQHTWCWGLGCYKGGREYTSHNSSQQLLGRGNEDGR